MLESLEIANFQTFTHLKLQDLRRVNLLAGKNNCGKTSLLEAIRIYAASSDNTVVNHILHGRGSLRPGVERSYDALFHQEALRFVSSFTNSEGKRSINLTINDLTIERLLSPNGAVRYRYERGADTTDDSSLLSSSVPFAEPNDTAVFVPFSHAEFSLEKNWKKIDLTPFKQNVIEVMQAIEPRVRDVGISSDEARILLAGNEKPNVLKSFGDGAQRALVLAVALVSARDNILLIDEFEAGLHHSVQESFWKIIFKFCREWNVQVFATTHSNDTIAAFAKAATERQDYDDALYLRLNKVNHEITATSYMPEELLFATENETETRGL